MYPKEITKLKGKRKISMLTCYDYVTAQALNGLGLDIVLVGDSLAMVAFGEKDTKSIGLDSMLKMAKAVKRGIKDSLVVFDMPIASYENPQQAYHNIQRVTEETGITAFKLEGLPDIAKFLVDKGIDIMGHSGLKPQSAEKYVVMGEDESSYKQVMREAKDIADAGVFAMVLECVRPELADEITKSISVPTIGIGASKNCDGQVLVLHDMLGFYDDIQPKFVRRYGNLKNDLQKAVKKYIDDVHSGEFPSTKEIY